MTRRMREEPALFIRVYEIWRKGRQGELKQWFGEALALATVKGFCQPCQQLLSDGASAAHRTVAVAYTLTTARFPSILPPEFLGLLRGVNVATPPFGNDIRKNSSINLTPAIANDEAEGPRKDTAVNADDFEHMPLAATGNDETGFFCFQLGPIQYTTGVRSVAELARYDLDWSQTITEVACVKIDDDGRATSIYVLPNVAQVRRGPLSGGRIYSGFSVANSSRGVGTNFWFNAPGTIIDKVYPPCEYVAAVWEWDEEGRGRVVREYVPMSEEGLEAEEMEIVDDDGSDSVLYRELF
jgi:hypothetical protein